MHELEYHDLVKLEREEEKGGRQRRGTRERDKEKVGQKQRKRAGGRESEKMKGRQVEKRGGRIK